MSLFDLCQADEDTAQAVSTFHGSHCPCHDSDRTGHRFPSQADPAQHLLLNCHCFILCSSSELALINPAGQKAAAQGWASSSLVVAKCLHQCPSLCLAWGALMVPSSSSLASRANRGMWDLTLMTLSIAVGVPSGKSVKFIVIHTEDLMEDLSC